MYYVSLSNPCASSTRVQIENEGWQEYVVPTTYKAAFFVLFLVIEVYHSLVYFNLWFCELVPITGNLCLPNYSPVHRYAPKQAIWITTTTQQFHKELLKSVLWQTGWGRERKETVWLSIPLSPLLPSCPAQLSCLPLLHQLPYMNFKKIILKHSRSCSLLIVYSLQMLQCKGQRKM